MVSLGGSLSGEHGDGQARGELLPKMFGPELMEAFREFKSIWDPEWRMNPGKVIDAAPIDAHLRLGADYDPPRLETHFHYPNDSGSFAKATLRCVGVGKCRRLDGGTMCPSFMATREEMHSTRGRARLLFEMLEGEPARRRLAERTGQGGARPLPRVQGVQGGLPGQRRHGHLQGRVPVALLRTAPPARLRLRLRADPLLGARGVAGAAGGQRRDADAAAAERGEARRRHAARPRHPRVRAVHVQAVDSSAARRSTRRRGRT